MQSLELKWYTSGEQNERPSFCHSHLIALLGLRTHTHSQYIIIIAFPRQQWLRESASEFTLQVQCLFDLRILARFWCSGIMGNDFPRIFSGSLSKQFTSSIGISLFIKNWVEGSTSFDFCVSLIMGHVKREIFRRFRTVIQIFCMRAEHRFFFQHRMRQSS